MNPPRLPFDPAARPAPDRQLRAAVTAPPTPAAHPPPGAHRLGEAKVVPVLRPAVLEPPVW